MRALPLCLLLWPAPLLAWTEATPTEADLSVTVSPNGMMTGVYRVTIDIDAGRFHGFDLDGLPADFEVDPATTTAHDARGRAIAVTAEPWRSGRLHAGLDTPGGERRGRVTVEIGFRARAVVTEDGDRASVEVSTPPWDHGMNRTTVTVDLPVPPGEIEVVDRDLYDEVGVSLSTSGARVHAMKYRLSRWTPMTVALRTPRARFEAVLGEPAAEPPRPKSAARAPASRPKPSPWPLVAIGIAPFALALWKGFETRRTARRAGCLARPLLTGLHPVLRGLAVLALSGAAVAALFHARVSATVGLLLLGGLVGAWRFGRAPDESPEPGRFVRVEPEELLAETRRAKAARRASLRLLDPSSVWGALFSVLLCAGAALVILRVLPAGLGPALGTGAALAAVLVVPLLTANGPTLPWPRQATEAKRLLALLPTLEAVVAAEGGGGIGPIALLPEGADRARHFRLRIGPACVPAGLRCLEVGIEHYGEGTAAAVLVRVVPSSTAESAVRHERRGIRIHESPSGDERVAVLRETTGTRALLSTLRRLLSRLRAEAAQSDAPAAPLP